MPEETVWRTMLFDFYGELLTPKQREFFDLHYNADLSLAEIAESTGTSRQAVWDIIRRAEATLRETEEKDRSCPSLWRAARNARLDGAVAPAAGRDHRKRSQHPRPGARPAGRCVKGVNVWHLNRYPIN